MNYQILKGGDALQVGDEIWDARLARWAPITDYVGLPHLFMAEHDDAIRRPAGPCDAAEQLAHKDEQIKQLDAANKWQAQQLKRWEDCASVLTSQIAGLEVANLDLRRAVDILQGEARVLQHDKLDLQKQKDDLRAEIAYLRTIVRVDDDKDRQIERLEGANRRLREKLEAGFSKWINE